MCGYVLLANMCGCYGPLMCDSSCERILQELSRINHAEAWDEKGIHELPFHLPEECMPGWHNTRAVYSDEFCKRYWIQCPTIVVPEWPFLYDVRDGMERRWDTEWGRRLVRCGGFRCMG